MICLPLGRQDTPISVSDKQLMVAHKHVFQEEVCCCYSSRLAIFAEGSNPIEAHYIAILALKSQRMGLSDADTFLARSLRQGG